jgi:hypothetical protein
LDKIARDHRGERSGEITERDGLTPSQGRGREKRDVSSREENERERERETEQ